ncbi:hypothetical protein Tco_0931510 [Tanacetum coccineum]
MTFVVMCKAYGGEPSVDLLWAFLNLGHAGNWLTLSNRIDLSVSKAMDFRIFMMEGVDVEFYFSLEGGVGDEDGRSPYTMFVNNETPRDEVILVDRVVADKAKNRNVATSSRVVGKMKQTAESLGRKTHQKSRKDLDKNPLVMNMRVEIENLQGQVDKLHGEYRRLVLEEKKWGNYEQPLFVLHSKVEGLETEMKRLKKSESQLLQEIDGLKQDRVTVVVKVVPHVATELVRSYKIGLLIARLVKTTHVHGRCTTFEEVADLKEPFELEKMHGYRHLSKKEFDQASDNLATASYSFLAEATADPYAPLDTLLSKRPKSLHAKPAPSQSKSKSSSLKTVNPTS